MGTMTGRRALVTGGAGGLGSVAVRTLLEMGAEDVLVVGRTQSTLDAFKARFPGRVSIQAFDTADPEAWKAFADRPIDILIPAAGVAHREPFLDSTVEHWQDMLNVNTVGTMLAVKTLLPGMITRGWGRIILVSSVAASIGLPGRAVYSASKAALEAWARALAAEIGSKGVLINCVAPGMFPTELTASWLAANPALAESIRNGIPERRFGDPEELAAAFRFLLETTYAQGSVLHIDGGWGVV
jgi:NAD(P)-dependent dehydrogenase (short-subunit alcohol dehydrogenase family)